MFALIINHHPVITYLIIILCIPIFVLIMVSVCTSIAILPIALLMGWL